MFVFVFLVFFNSSERAEVAIQQKIWNSKEKHLPTTRDMTQEGSHLAQRIERRRGCVSVAIKLNKNNSRESGDRARDQ